MTLGQTLVDKVNHDDRIVQRLMDDHDDIIRTVVLEVSKEENVSQEEMVQVLC